MRQVTLEFPEDVFSALRRSPEEFARELRLAAAMHWYSRVVVSQEKAAQMSGPRSEGLPLEPCGEPG